MNEILKVILSLSFSGSLLMIILFLLRPVLKERLSRQWQYYIWLIVIARLMLPFTSEPSLIGTLQEKFTVMSGQQNDSDDIPFIGSPIYGQNRAENERMEPVKASVRARTALVTIWENLWLVWFVTMFLLFIRKITVYQDFVTYIRAGSMEVGDISLLEQFGKLVEKSKVKAGVELYTNSLISSPLLLGFFHPCIVLPSADLSSADFEYTVLHELTHFKRGDMFYKWLVQSAVCAHWFNPLVYLMSREISRACELSCDENVIKPLNPEERRAYGDTLLNALGAGGSYKASLASVTLSESKERLKERLDAIMKFKKTSRFTAAVSFVLAVVLSFGATFMGAYAASDTYAASGTYATSETHAASDVKGTVVIDLSSNGRTSITQSSSFEAESGQILTLEITSSIKGAVDLFLFSPSNEEQRITFGGSDETKTVHLSEGRWAYNCTGFFDSGEISIVGTLSFAQPEKTNLD